MNTLQRLVLAFVSTIPAALGDELVVANDAKRCGPIALEVIGLWLEEERLAAASRDEFPENELTNLAMLAGCAERSGFPTALVKWSENDDLSGCPPAIIPVRNAESDTHFVPVLSVDGDIAVVLDFPHRPATVSLRSLRLSEAWDGSALHVAKSRSELPRASVPYLRGAAGGLLALSCVGMLVSVGRGRRRVRVSRGLRAAGRSGFTVVELLVSVAIIAALAALVLPSVQSAREAARRLSCADGMRQTTLAMQNFESLWRVFPGALVGPGCPEGFPERVLAPHAMILPQIDRSDLYEQLDGCEAGGGAGKDPPTSKRNADLLGQPIPLYVCPSDAVPVGGNSFRVSIGPTPHRFKAITSTGESELGAFANPGGFTAASVSDGLSSTMFLSERLCGDRESDRYLPHRDVFHSGIYSRTPEEAQTACRLNAGASPPHSSYAGETWLFAGYAQTWFNTISVPNAPLPDCMEEPAFSTGLSGSFAARSNHPGGVNITLGDGASRFVSQAIDLALWRAVSTSASADRIPQW